MSPVAVQRRRRALRGSERLQGLVRDAWGGLALEDSGRLGLEAYAGMCVRLQDWIAPGLQGFNQGALFEEDAPEGTMPWGEFQDAIFTLTEAWVDRSSERAHADFLGAMLQASFPSGRGARRQSPAATGRRARQLRWPPPLTRRETERGRARARSSRR